MVDEVVMVRGDEIIGTLPGGRAREGCGNAALAVGTSSEEAPLGAVSKDGHTFVDCETREDGSLLAHEVGILSGAKSSQPPQNAPRPAAAPVANDACSR